MLDVRRSLSIGNIELSTSNSQHRTSSSISFAERRFPRAVIDVFVLKLGGELGGKVIHFHDNAANTGNEKVVAEHRRNSDTERGHSRDERAGNTRRHRDQA